MALTAAQLREASLWLDQHTQASQQIKVQTALAARAAWEAVEPDWYDLALTYAVASEMAELSQAGQDIIAGSAQQFVANVVALLRGARVTIPRVTLPPIRNGVPLRNSQVRVADAYKRAIANGHSHLEALNIAYKRAEDMQWADLTLAERQASSELMKALGVVHFRRIVRPELSRTGSCGLCIAAADRVYNVGDLMPIHPPSCKCIVMPIIGEDDPGLTLNEDDLQRLYGDAGSSNRRDLSQTRYTVVQHGEYGPTLVRQDQNFRGPDRIRLEDDPDRAARMLEKALPVLADLERRDRAGENVSGPLAYQRGYVERLSRIVGI